MPVPKTRLWVISELYYPEETSTGYFLTAIAEGLAEDFEVHVICGKPSYSERGRVVARKEIRNNVVIHRMRATHFDKDRLFLRAVNSITLAIAVALMAVFRFRRGDKVLIVTNPPTLPPILGWIAKAKSVSSHLLVHDVYPDVLAVTGFMKPKGVHWRAASKFFDSSMAQFDSIVVLGRDMKALIERKLEAIGRSRPIYIIPNWGDVEEIRPIARSENPFAIQHNLVGKTVVQFSGNIGRTHDIALLLEVAKRVEDLDNLIFLFVGYGGQAREVANQNRANLRYLPRQPREMLNSMLACSDVTVVAFKESMAGVSVPSRMYNIMAAGVPIAAIADLDAELTRTVTENEAGWRLAPGDCDGLERLIRYVATPEGKREAQAYGDNARAAVVEQYTLSQVLKSYRALL